MAKYWKIILSSGHTASLSRSMHCHRHNHDHHHCFQQFFNHQIFFLFQNFSDLIIIINWTSFFLLLTRAAERKKETRRTTLSFKGQKKSLRAFDAVSQNRHRRNSKKWEFTILVDFIVFLFSFWHKKSFHKINATLSLMVHTYPWPLTSLLLSIWKGFTVRTDKNVSFKFYLSHKISRPLLTRLDMVVH